MTETKDYDKSADPKNHATNHEDGGSDEIDLTDLPGKTLFIDRGDPLLVDFQGATLVADNNWNEIDLSSIIPAKSVAVWLRLEFSCVLAAATAQFRTQGNVNERNREVLYMYKANTRYYLTAMLAVNQTLKIAYRLSPYTWARKLITVAGWLTI